MANPITSFLLRFASRLRFPQLFAVVLVLFLVDLFVPDFIPFFDELILGLLALLLGSLRKRDDVPVARN
jgi:uncharacterized membrane protein YesL